MQIYRALSKVWVDWLGYFVTNRSENEGMRQQLLDYDLDKAHL